MLCKDALGRDSLFFIVGERALSFYMLVDLCHSFGDFKLLVLSRNYQECQRLSSILRFFQCKNVLLPEGQESAPLAARGYAFEQIADKQNDFDVILATDRSILELMLWDRDRQRIEIVVGRSLPYESLSQQLVHKGYQRASGAELAYHFDILGDCLLINDGFRRYRIDCIGDEVESITDLNLKERYQRISIFDVRPKSELSATEGRNKSLRSLIGRFVVIAEDSLLARCEPFIRQAFDAEAHKMIVLTVLSLYKKGYQRLMLNFYPVPNFFKLSKKLKINFLQSFADYYRANPANTLIALPESTNLQKMQSMLEGVGLHPLPVASIAQVGNNGLFITTLPIERGFTVPGLSIISGYELIGVKEHSGRTKTSSNNSRVPTPSMAIGDLVIHKDYGLGRFLGLQELTVGKVKYQCLCVEYHGQDKLFVPVENTKLLTRYGSDAQKPVALDRLRSVAWQRRKARVKKRIQLIADELIRVAALRELQKGKVCIPKADDYESSNNRFLHMLTVDQINAIAAIEQDLSSGRVMNRLICGDTGFGKTEVALRAAFMVANTHPAYQVAVITPTTLLARQLFLVFSERFEGTGVEVAHLSGLVDAQKAFGLRKQLQEGAARIVVGTHSLLNCQFQNLTLLIVDEEHCFGVKQKEALKQKYAGAHVLFLSATPIPRTLHMSLSGVCDLSVLATPPVERQETEVFVIKEEDEVIEEAIRYERNRGGQIFYVSPRIKDIDSAVKKLHRMVPEFKIAVIHGKLPKASLERITNDFYDGKYDILLSTTIIESGLDVPNANTIIISNSELLGVSQLYQLKGRVGRRNITARAYFVISDDCDLKTEKRLEAIRSLKTAMEIATCDMDARGFGNLIGEDQSGHIKEVGLELYQQMLQEALRAISADSVTEDANEIKVDLNASKGIPDEYIECFSTRMHFYESISRAKSAEDLVRIEEELLESFGPIPESLMNLMLTVRLQNEFSNTCVRSISVREGHVKLALEMDQLLKASTALSKRGLALDIRDAQSIILSKEAGDDQGLGVMLKAAEALNQI